MLDFWSCPQGYGPFNSLSMHARCEHDAKYQKHNLRLQAGRVAMRELTVWVGFVRGLVQLAVSKGANEKT